MKYLVSAILFSFILLIDKGLVAQNLSKTEIKAIKAELKKYKKNPLLYKLKIEKLRKECEDKDEEIYELEARLKENRNVFKTLNDSIALMHNAIDILVGEMEAVVSESEPEKETPEPPKQKVVAENVSEKKQVQETYVEKPVVVPEPEGTVYKVQVGYFKSLNLSDHFDDPKLFAFERVDGGFSYNIGYFDTYKEASRFAADMKKLGITDAFVTKYSNGKRIN